LQHVSKSFLRKSEVKILRKHIEQRQVLKDVTLEVHEGDVVCVLGKNGSGKTTLMRILSTLVEPDAGLAEVSGLNVVTESDEVKKHVGVMLNSGEGGFHARLSALANLVYYGALYGIPSREAKRRAVNLLKDLEVDDRGDDQFQSYSTGMRRRTALARALLHDASVLLLDEPTLGVDPWSTSRIHSYLRELSHGGKTILCTTNNPLEAQALGGQCLVLKDGMLQSFRTEEVLAS
jgi:ABC-2 type transport system ATP-binding protein